jgi:hypothetical protein
MEFSNKSPKASENNMNSILRDWNRGWTRSQRERQFTIRSLHMWAKQDNPKRYREIMTNSFVDFVEREVDATHTHIARLMKRMYENNYCAAVDSKKVDWKLSLKRVEIFVKNYKMLKQTKTSSIVV